MWCGCNRNNRNYISFRYSKFRKVYWTGFRNRFWQFKRSWEGIKVFAAGRSKHPYNQIVQWAPYLVCLGKEIIPFVAGSFIRSEALWGTFGIKRLLKIGHTYRANSFEYYVHQLSSMRGGWRTSLPTSALTCCNLYILLQVANMDSMSRFVVKFGTGPPKTHFGSFRRFLPERGRRVCVRYPQTLCTAHSSIECSCVIRH